VRLADDGNSREYERISLHPEQLTEIYKLVSDTNEPVTYKFGDYLVESFEDLKELTQMRRRPKKIYVSTGTLSLYISPTFAKIRAFGDTDLRVFVAIDSLIGKHISFWSAKNVSIFFFILGLGSIIDVTISVIWSTILPTVLFTTFWVVMFIWFLYLSFWSHRFVHIKWPRQGHWLPNPGQLISSVLTVIITGTIVFLAATYLSPQVKPYLDWLLLGAPHP